MSHGTETAGIVAQVASSGNVAMINVFNGTSTTSADVLNALDWGIESQATYNIVSVNMSLGDGGDYTASSCPTDLDAAVGSAANPSGAYAAGIGTAIASGNNGYSDGISFPGCTPGAISVGSVYDSTLTGTTDAWTNTTPVADQVACFTNMGPNLILLAPGDGGTSFAAPHVAGSIAALRAQYPRESLSQTLLRMTSKGTIDSRSGYSLPRIDLYKSFELGTSPVITGTGPTVASAGRTASYSLIVTNNGPLTATNVSVTDTLPSLANFVSASPGCSASAGEVTCTTASLTANANISFTITVTWTGNGTVYDTATVNSDQIDSAPAQASIAFGTAPGNAAEGEVPVLPPWAMGLLAGALFAARGKIVRKELRRG